MRYTNNRIEQIDNSYVAEFSTASCFGSNIILNILSTFCKNVVINVTLDKWVLSFNGENIVETPRRTDGHYWINVMRMLHLIKVIIDDYANDTIESNMDVNHQVTNTNANVINHHDSNANESTSLGGTPDSEIGGTEGLLLGGISSLEIKSLCCESKLKLCTLPNQLLMVNCIEELNEEVAFKIRSTIYV